MDFESIVDIASADDLAAGIHVEGVAVGAAEGAQIDHPVRPRPQEGMLRTVQRALADDLAAVVRGHGSAEIIRRAAEGAEIDHPLRSRP